MTYSVKDIHIDESLSFTPGPTAGYVLSIDTDGSTYWSTAPIGITGSTGATGPQGEQGIQGEQGVTGSYFETIPDTGVVISFTEPTIYNTSSSPATGNITDDLTSAKIGIVQKIYHNHSSAPTVPAGWVLMGSNDYVISVLNTIYCEWTSGTRVEYWVVQEN